MADGRDAAAVQEDLFRSAAKVPRSGYWLLGGPFGVAENWCVLGFQQLPALSVGSHNIRLQ